MIVPLWQQTISCFWCHKWPSIVALYELVARPIVCLAPRLFRFFRAQPKFEYEALEDPTSWIRLLTLLPSPNYGDIVVCELIAVRLDEAPSYEALSYHWGDGTHNQALIVNGRQKLITNSLLQALKDLRRPFRPRILWVDGLCINQGEDAVEERNMQLFQMQTVFSQASRVMARLSDANLDFWHILSLFEKIQTVQNLTLKTAVQAAERELASKIEAFYSPMVKFARLPWWRRVWVFQEVIVAKELTLFCGVAELPWTSLRRAALLSARRGTNEQHLWAMHIARMTHLREEHKLQKQLSLIDLLSTVRGTRYGVTNPKDRVLALLGLCKERQEINRCYQPDYKQSLEEIYCKVSRLAIHISRSTKILSYASPKSDLPSWTPDWRTGSSRQDWDRLHSTLDSLTGILYRASSGSRSILYEGNTPTNVLKLKGVLFDTVKNCHRQRGRSLYTAWKYFQKQQRKSQVTKSHESFFCQDVLLQMEDCWITGAINRDAWHERCAGVLHNSYVESEDQDPMLTILLALKDLWLDANGMPRRMNTHVLLSMRNYLLEKSPGNDEFCDELERYAEQLLESGTDVIRYRSNRSLDGISAGDAGAALARDKLLDLYETAEQRIAEQLIGCTSKGYWMASSCWELEVGDRICVFAGGSVPYALRRRDDHYILMGEVYVHGIMDGEVMEAVDRHEHELEWIALK